MVIPYDDYTVTGGGTTNGYDNVRTGSGLAVPKSAARKHEDYSLQHRAAFLMLFTRIFRLSLEPSRPGQRLHGYLDCGQTRGPVQCWFSGPADYARSIMRRESDARINSFPTQIRLPSSKRLSPIRWVRRVGAVAWPIKPIR